MRTKLLAAVSAAVLTTTLTACAAGSTKEAAGDYPSEDLTWTIAFGSGGGNDLMSRKMVDIIEKKKLYPENIKVENREGGSGATGWGYLFGKKGTGYDVSTTSGSFLTTPLQSDPGWTYKDFTPVGLMATDDALLLTDGKKKVDSWEEWVTYAKKKGKVVVGGIGTVNVDFILHSMIAEQAGYEIEYVPYNEEGQVQTSLLSGALDAMVSNPGSILGQVEADKMNALLFTGKKPLASLPDVPTGEEVGIKELPSMPRGFILPPDAPDAAVKWWTKTMKTVVATKEWKDYVKDNNLTSDVRWGDEFGDYLEDTTKEFKTTLEEQGAL